MRCRRPTAVYSTRKVMAYPGERLAFGVRRSAFGAGRWALGAGRWALGAENKLPFGN